MIVTNLIQTRANFGKIYELRDGEEIIGIAEEPVKIKKEIEVSILNQKFYLEFAFVKNIKNNFNFGKNAKLSLFQIYNENKILVGSLCQRRTKFLFGYFFFELELKNEMFYFYVVGLGKEGLKIPVYDENDVQVALIEKNPVMYNNKSTYTITSLNERYQAIAFLWSVYYDSLYFSEDETAGKKKEVSYVYTLNKELKKKYNVKFKENLL